MSFDEVIEIIKERIELLTDLAKLATDMTEECNCWFAVNELEELLARLGEE